MTVEFRDVMRDEMVKYLVQRAIVCPITQDVLDVRTCVVVLDSDDDPAAVLSPNGYRQLVAIASIEHTEPLKAGLRFDPKTIPADPKPEKENHDD